MMLKSQAVANFLKARSPSDLAALYNKGMEVQVLVDKGRGEPIDIGHLRGRTTMAYTDGVQTWKAFRIPWKAMSEPEDNDGPIDWDFDEHVLGIGMTGWDWQNKVSRWVAYDFDAMLGHSDKHQKKLTESELAKVQDVVSNLPYVTVRRSTSGRGLHLYIFLDAVPTNTHTEHAALARSILSSIAGTTGFNFTDKVDICGGNMWVWHRKMLGTNGLQLIRQGDILKNIPPNWKDHAPVINKSSRKVVIDTDSPRDVFEELSGQRSKVKLDDEHRKLIKYLEDNNLRSWWDADNHMLVAHTKYLEAYAKQCANFRGEFHTLSSGKDYGNDINCFLFPCRNGVWAVRRHGLGTKEHDFWNQDGKGYTRCYFNRELTLGDAARLLGAIELEGGGYQFPDSLKGQQGLLKIKIECNLPPWIHGRPMRIKESRNENKIVVTIPRDNADNPADMKDWLPEPKCYRRLFNNPVAGLPDEAIALGDFDNVVRHITNEVGEDLGWMISTNGVDWRAEPLNHVRILLGSQGHGRKDIDIILGRCISQPWIVVNKPFESEYPGDRQWNRSKAKFKIAPSTEGDQLSYPTWRKILDHCGSSLDGPIAENKWCVENGIRNGGDYLFLWYACLVNHPRQPLPFLGLHGDQDTGKSTLHEAFCECILDGGFMDGNTALNNSSNFNAELEGMILCPLEELDLRKKDTYNKLKDWITSPRITIHPKGQTPYKAHNYLHFIQCVNERAFIPVFEGDKRLVLLHVPPIKEEDMIPKRDLWQQLTKEAPDFLAALLAAEIPDSRDRLMIPIIASADKIAAEFDSMNPVERFFKEEITEVDGSYESVQTIHRAFIVWMMEQGEDHEKWSKNKFGASAPAKYPKGRIHSTKTQDRFIGNITLKKGDLIPKPDIPWVSTGVSLVRKKNVEGLSGVREDSGGNDQAA